MSSVATWDLQTGKEIPRLPGHRAPIESVSFAPDGKQVLTGGADSVLLLWDVAAGAVLHEFVSKYPPALGFFGPPTLTNLFHVHGAFMPDGKRVVGLPCGGKLQVWNTADGKATGQLGSGGYHAFAFSPDGKTLALAGPQGIELWDPLAGKQRPSVPPPKASPQRPVNPFFSQEGFSALAFSPDGRLLVSTAFRSELTDNSLDTQSDYLELASGRKRIQFARHGEMVAPRSTDLDSMVFASESLIGSFAFAPDGGKVAEAGSGSISLRSLQNGKQLRTFGGKEINCPTALFSPDGTILLAAKRDGGLRLWDVSSGTVLLDFPSGQSPVTALAVSADGKRLATGARDGSVLVWSWEHIRRQANVKPPRPGLVQLWTDLAADDAATAFAAMGTLIAAPAEAVPFLNNQLRPVLPVDARLVKDLLAKLDDKQYSVRKRAQQALEELGDLAAQAIKDELARSPSLEMTRRLEAMAKKLDRRLPNRDVLRVLRAVEVLERIGGTEARRMVQRLAQGARGHRVTEDARSTLVRMSGS
jgi:WD40 repeat protein